MTLDTYRADRVGVYGNRLGLTPHLDALAASGTRFDAAWSAAPLTAPSHTTMMTGLLPVAHGVRQNGSGELASGIPTLASRLEAAGFRTGAFVSAFVLNRRFGLARGFATYDDEIAQRPGRPAGIEAQRPGRETVDRALAWLAAREGRRWFLWVHLFDAHAPYEPPEPYKSRFAAPYDGEIATTDAELGRLLDALAASGQAAKTLVVAAGDHGEALGEHGEPTHGLLLYEPTLRVPLVLVAPGAVAAGGVVRTPVSLVDLAPTIADLLGVDWPAGQPGRSGIDLAPALRSAGEPDVHDLYAETEYPRLFGWSAIAALRRGGEKFVHAPEPELYDLAADPGEVANRYDSDRRIAAEMKRAIDDLRAGALDASTAAPDEEAQRKLAALGYVGGSAPASGPRAADPKRMAPLFSRLEQARQMMEGGNAAEAVRELTRLVGEDPGNPVFRGTRALALRRLGQSEEAVRELRQTLAAGPGSEQALYDLAATLHDAGRRDEAEKVLTELLRRDPRHAEAHNSLGILRLESGDFAAAGAEFARALDAEPGNATAANNLANALRAQGRLAPAEQAYRRALALAPDWADPWNGLGALLVQSGRAEESLAAFGRALELAPAMQEARLNRAIALDTLGRKEEAAAAYREFLTLTRGDARFAPQRQAAQALLDRLGPH